MKVSLVSEARLGALAGRVGQTWLAAGCRPLVIGLRGQLGAGKTSWVRALLRGLGFGGRVPSPTYTLLEHYEGLGGSSVPLGPVTLVHLDLYRLESDADLENIGVRDWLGRDDVWIVAEWPERAAQFALSCDLILSFAIVSSEARTIDWQAQTVRGAEALAALSELLSNYQS